MGGFSNFERWPRNVDYMITAYNTYAPTTRGVYVGAQKAKMGLVDQILHFEITHHWNEKGNNDNTTKLLLIQTLDHQDEYVYLDFSTYDCQSIS